MKSYKVTFGALAIGQGVKVELTPEQARPRRHKLAPVADIEGNVIAGLFVASDVLMFKAGETVKIDGELARSQTQRVEALDAPDDAPPKRLALKKR